MRGIGRFIAGLILVLAILAGAGWLLRAPLAGAALRAALASAGVENPSLSVADISLSRIALKDVAAGADRADPDLAVSAVEATFDWRALLSERRLKTVFIGKGALAIRIAGDGAVSLAGFPLKKSEGGGGAGGFPFDSLTIDDLALAVGAPEGAASGRVSGGFESQSGGSFSVTVETALIAANDFRAEKARVQGVVDFRPDGTAAIKGDVAGDFASPQARADGVALSLKGEGASWRDAIAGKSGAISGRAAIDLRSAEIAVGESPALAWLAGLRRPDEEPIRAVALSGGLAVALSGGRLTVEAGAAPLRAESDRGDGLAISPREAAPLYERAAGVERLSAAARLSGEGLAGEGALTAERQGGAGWRFDAAASFDEQAFPAVTFGATKASAVGSFAEGVTDADVALSTLVKTARVGRLIISDTAVGSTVRVRTDFAAGELQASSLDASCVVIEHAQVRFEGQDSEMRFADGEFCRAEGPLIVARWGEAPGAAVAGRLTAREAHLRFARTRFAGAPPSVEFEGSYEARPQRTRIDGAFAGGRLTLNDALIGSDADGRFTFRLDPEGMSSEAFLDRVRIVQNAKTLTVAPLIAAGTARLADDRISFDYAASTSRGEPLGAGEGAHDIRSGKGETTFRSGDLVFAPKGLQPAAVLLALKGIVGETEGVASGEVRALWGPKADDFKTSGALALNDVSFIGPGTAVTKTAGVTGKLTLSNLAPLTSEGPQTLEIKLIDLDSLKLENGVARFDLPGDETLRILDAEFPWYGGTIGAYDTVAAITGGKVTTALRAENVDFGELLALADVDGLSGEGKLSGTIPLVFEDGKARIVNGILTAVGPGALRYVGKAAESAAAAGPQADVAFSILRDLRFISLKITINGPLDGRLAFKSEFEGAGDVPYGPKTTRMPVRYNIFLDAALLDLLNQASLTRSIKMQIERARLQSREGESETPEEPQ